MNWNKRTTREEHIFELKQYLRGHSIFMCPSSSLYWKEHWEEVIKALEQQPSEDCVSRAELKKWLDMNFSFGGALRKLELFDRLDKELPPVTPTQKTGRWIDNHNGTFTCDSCGCKHSKSKFCPNCGAKMESEDKE